MSNSIQFGNEPNVTGFLIGGIIALIAGIVTFLFINVWVGAVALLAAEILFACSRTKIKGYVKSGNPTIEKADLKQAIKDFEAEHADAKACHILTIIAFCLFIPCIFFIR